MNSQVTKLLFTETGTYNDMPIRPLYSHLEAPELQMFQEVTQGGKQLTANHLARVAPMMLRPKTEIEGIANIANGWGERRFRFMMEVRHGGVMGSQVLQYLTGYTDHAGIGHAGTLDPQMRLFFNNTLTVRGVVESTPLGNMMRSTVADASHVLVGNYRPTFGSQDIGHRTLRPEDVFATMGHSILGSGDVMDLRTSFAGGIMKSRRSNGSAPIWLSKTLQAHKTAFNDDTNNANDYGQLLDDARGATQEGLISQDGFLSQLQRFQTSLVEGGSISYGELCAVSPGLDNIVHVFPITQVQRQKEYIHSAGDTRNWTGQDPATIVATTLSYSVPSIMMDMMLTGIHFMATNQTLDGSVRITPLGAQSFAEGIDLTPYIQHFMVRLDLEVLSGLFSNNLIDYNIEMGVDILGETMIKVSIGGNPQEVFVIPSFADALCAPIITLSGNTLSHLAYDIDNLVNNLDTIHTNTNSSFGALNNGFSTTL